MNNYVTFHNICKKYKNAAWIHEGENGCGFYSRISAKEIVIPSEAFHQPDSWDIFALLHEIGHIMTNTTKMKRCEQEYFATQWAIDEAKRMNLKVQKRYLDIYQDYIWKWRETSIRLKGKNVPLKEALCLKY